LKLNTKAKSDVLTHGGGNAKWVSPELMLKRSVCACLLWENEFYEDGETITKRIKSLVPQCDPQFVSELAIEARTVMNLRHVPLLLAVEMTKYAIHKKYVAMTLEKIIQRPDEITEYLAIYFGGSDRRVLKSKLSKQSKKGLRAAFYKFNEYSLAKYNQDGGIKLRDALFLVHANPKTEAQADLFKRLADKELKTPDTWEVALSAGANKKETFLRLIQEKKLGALAFLKNLRGMHESGVSESVVAEYIANVDLSKVLPFRFISAARMVPQWESVIDIGFLRRTTQMPKLKGKTVVIIDVSGSMYGSRVSAKSDMTRALAACALAAICRELCETSSIYATAGNDGMRIHKTVLVPSRHGMALVDAIHSLSHPLGGGGIFLKQVMDYVRTQEKTADRTIIITDEQDCSQGEEDSPSRALPLGTGYLINVASNQFGIGYDRWTHFDGFSESIMTYLIEAEKWKLAYNRK
jgi:hypothetical protein